MSGMVIIGAGECGTRAAFALREAGWTGPVTLIGAEAGLPYERPPLSKPEGGVVRRKAICDAAALAAAGIDYRPGVTVQAIDRAARQARLSQRGLAQRGLAQGMLGYDRLLLATGARPRRLTCPGADRALDLRSHADAEAIFSAPQGTPVAIIGAGLIGMELAAALRTRGHPVTVIEAGPRPLSRAVPARFADALLARHLAEGVAVLLGETITGITAEAVTLTSGRQVPAGMVIVAIGVVPETGLAEAAGLATGNGIVTDALLRTADPDILAAGDCAAVQQPDGSHHRSETWRNARTQAEAAARAMLGQPVPAPPPQWFWSDQYDLGLQVAGRPDPGHRMILRSVGTAEIAFFLDNGRLVATAGLGPGTAVARDVKLAEMLIAAGLHPDPAALADPGVNLKTLLRPARAA